MDDRERAQHIETAVQQHIGRLVVQVIVLETDLAAAREAAAARSAPREDPRREFHVVEEGA